MATDNPFDKSGADLNLRTVVDMLGEIINTPPLKTGDSGVYYIKIKNGDTTKTIALSAAQLLKGPGTFCTSFFVAFKKILFATVDDWPTFVKYIAANAVSGPPEETPAMVAGYMLVEEIASRWPVTKDKHVLGDGAGCRQLVEHSPHGVTYYAAASAAILDLLEELPGNVPGPDVSQALTVCGYKIKNTSSVTPTGIPSLRCWLFEVDKLREINGNLGVEK